MLEDCKKKQQIVTTNYSIDFILMNFGKSREFLILHPLTLSPAVSPSAEATAVKAVVAAVFILIIFKFN